MRKKKPGQDFEEFMQEARQDKEVAEFLNSFSVAVGDIVLARRTKLGWTQQALAQKSETTQARISQIESGFGGIKLETLNKVFEALGLESLVSNFREDAASIA